ncbi:alpha-sarcoglycan-like [Spea bombifrons]|uniref:alpha-sarcoglycan-like n=1 Tax=Spea bombifrons TaxID=233779 RepID=UPI00234B4AC2|nr:alpha-sarcoglycan-like [Spea bombifrons]
MCGSVPWSNLSQRVHLLVTPVIAMRASVSQTPLPSPSYTQSILLLCHALSGGLCDQNVYPFLGTLIVHELDPEYFQQQFPSIKNNYGVDRTDPITFRANLEGFPDLPGWLRYTQRSPFHEAFLYGSPTEPGKQIIEVTAYNRHTSETFRERLIFNIDPTTGLQTPFQAEFLIRNLNIEEMLPPETQLDFQAPLQDVWGPQRLTVVNITSALDRGGRVPLPLRGLKEGVYIKVGSDVPFSGCLLESQSPHVQKLCQAGGQPIVSCYDRFAEYFDIDWCNVSLISDSESPSVRPERGSGILDDGSEFNPPSKTLEDTHYLSDYLLTMLIPSLIALLLCAFLCYIMCCRREGIQKRDAETSDIQLIHQQSIFSNTEELRHMASNRDVPRPLSTLPMFNVHTGQRVNPSDLCEDSSRVPLILSQH